MNIRLLSLSDFGPVYTMWKWAQLWVYEPGKEQHRFNMLLEHNPDICFCGEMSDGTIIATALGTFDGVHGMVYRVAVHPDYQRKGYARKLLSKVEQVLADKGASSVLIRVHERNTEAQFFYKQVWYEGDGTFLLKKEI